MPYRYGGSMAPKLRLFLQVFGVGARLWKPLERLRMRRFLEACTIAKNRRTKSGLLGMPRTLLGTLGKPRVLLAAGTTGYAAGAAR